MCPSVTGGAPGRTCRTFPGCRRPPPTDWYQRSLVTAGLSGDKALIIAPRPGLIEDDDPGESGIHSYTIVTSSTEHDVPAPDVELFVDRLRFIGLDRELVTDAARRLRADQRADDLARAEAEGAPAATEASDLPMR